MAIALTGRPNVGKSSLFNRLIQKRKALVWDKPGVTRDLVRGQWLMPNEKEVEIWDFAGWGKFGQTALSLSDDLQDEIELIVIVVDGSEPLTQEDYECFAAIRKLGKPMIVALNKVDKKNFKIHSAEIYSVFSVPILSISAEHRLNIGDLEDEMMKVMTQKKSKKVKKQKNKSDKKEGRFSSILILGRPNVGKSSLINALTGEAVAMVSDQPGTTRDPNEAEVHDKDRSWKFIDSAGIRRKSKIYGRGADPIEIFSATRAMQHIDSSDFCLLMIEANEKGDLHTQDRKLLRLIRHASRPTAILVNKWDTIRNSWKEKDYRNELRDHLKDLDFLPILFISAKTGYHLPKIFQILKDLEKNQKQISTGRLNKWLKETLAKRAPRMARKSTPLQFNYVVQTQTKPMIFQIFCNIPTAVAEDDKRYFANQIRSYFALVGMPLKLVFRRK